MTIGPLALPRDGIERMTALDAGFLFAETPRTPMHLGSVSIFEGAPFFDEQGGFRLDEVRRRIEERLPLLPRFRQRAHFLPLNFARPLWVDDADFDITNHVKLMVLPSPGSREELDELSSHLQMRMLDRTRPLWELWFIGGLDDGNVALVEKIHHAMVDGISGVEVAAALLDLERAPAVRRVEPWAPASPSGAALVVEGVCESVAEPVAAARHVGARVLSIGGLHDLATGVPDLVRSALGHGRSTGLQGAIGGRRTLRSVSEPLEALRTTAHRYDATINDVALASVGGGVRALMAARGDAYEDAQLHVLVPVSKRGVEEQHALGNRVSAMVVPVPVGEPDVVARLRAVRDDMARAKADHRSAPSELVVDSIDLLPSTLLAPTSRAIHRQPLVDIVVTNVPGPPCPLYLCGAELLESVPLVPLGGNLSIGVAILSYNGQLTFGVHADTTTCPDVAVFVDGLRRDLDDLAALAGDVGAVAAADGAGMGG